MDPVPAMREGSPVTTSKPEGHRYRQVLESATRAVRARHGLVPPDAEDDVVQEVMLRYLRAFPDGNEPDNLDGWTTAAVANLAIDKFRARERRDQGRLDEDVDLLDRLLPRGGGLSSDVAQRKIMMSALALLNDRDRILIQLRHLDNLPARDVAAKLDMEPAAVDQAVRRARQRFERAIEERPDLYQELRGNLEA